jgi:hypothetical protein
MEEQTDKCYKELQLYQQQIRVSNEKAKQYVCDALVCLPERRPCLLHHSLITGAQCVCRYYTVDLPRIFDQLQQLETQRLNTLRDYMKKYVDIQSGSMDPFKVCNRWTLCPAAPDGF